MTGISPAHDRLSAALLVMESAAAENAERSLEIRRRAADMRSRLDVGDRVLELVGQETQPRMVELLSANMATLETAGAELRVAQALALREEGLTIMAIAEIFGVTRQRISALLKQRSEPD